MTPKLVQQFKMNKCQLSIKPVSNVHKKTPTLLIIWINETILKCIGDLLQMTAGTNRLGISPPAVMDYLLHVIFSSS